MADEKEEKEEKERQADEKHEEKSPDEKWRRDPLGAVVWACILIWAGVVLMLSNAGTLGSIADSLSLEKLEAWPVISLGIGAILLGEIVVRLIMPVYRRPIIGTLILAVIFLGAGVQQITNKDIVWALVLIAIGIGLLFRGAFRR